MIEEVVYLDVSLRLRGLFTFVYLWMNYRIPEKVILRRVLTFYLTTILETGTSILLLTIVKNTGRTLIGIPLVFWF